MTQEEIKERCMAIATYAGGWEEVGKGPAKGLWGSRAYGPELYGFPPFYRDMNLMAGVMQKVVSGGVEVLVKPKDGGKVACNAVGYIAGAPKDTVQEALFTTLSLFVMMKQSKDL